MKTFHLALTIAGCIGVCLGSGPAAAGDPTQLAEAVDRLVDREPASRDIPTSPIADDAEFLRRVTLDLTGRIPTYHEAVEFLASTDAEKRRIRIRELLVRPAYGQNLAAVWRELIEPRELGSVKTARDNFTPWLADQFNRNRGWDEIVRDLLTAEGKIKDLPQSRFIMANSVNFEPQPNMLADSTAKLFWGVQLRCAECHDHPFAPWTQQDFWSTAAFFSRTRKGHSDGKNPQGWTLTEEPIDDPVSRQFTKLFAAKDVSGPAIEVPDSGGKLATHVIKGQFLGGEEAGWSDDGPFRPRFADWATKADHPYFARNMVNRLWAHLFGRGLVHPLDDAHHGNPPSHPELLDCLAKEFAAADFDLQFLLTALCQTRAYQRTSRPLPANVGDNRWYSRQAVRVITPGALYDSLSIVLNPVEPKSGSGAKRGAENVQPIAGVPRDEFLRFFAARPDDNSAGIVNQGIPQFLRLMNGEMLHGKFAGVSRFEQLDQPLPAKIEALFLACYARRPTAEELTAATTLVTANDDRAESLAGLMWVLLNSAEFTLNH